MPYFALPPEPPPLAVLTTSPFTQQAVIQPPPDATVGTPQKQWLAQAIVPAADGVGTQVTPQGQRFDITGGQQSRDGANLFHSFQKLGLSDGQIANFLTHPQTLNVLGRVVGGEASLINGRLQITGSNANLFLINPAGIIFGNQASLQVPGAFMATTANRLGFGPGSADQWLNAIGTNDYAALVGTPTTFAFTTATAGAIVNAGNLAVGPGQSLTLLGGTVVNTGTLTAPGGQITIAAIPGEHLVRLSQVNRLLSLELAALPPATAPSPAALPALLTGGDLANATGLTVNPNGTIQLTGSARPVALSPGTTLVSGQVSVRGGLPGSQPQITVLGDRMALLGATLDASGVQAGTIRIGGNYRGQGPLPTAQFTYVDDLTRIHADGLTAANSTILPATAAGGNIILWSNESTYFAGTITARSEQAGGNGGFVEVSSQGNLAFQGTVDVTAAEGTNGTLLLDPTNIIIQTAGANDNQLNAGVPNAPDPAGAIFAADGGAVDFTLSAAVLTGQAGNVILEATNNITIAPGVSLVFTSGGGSITFTADADQNGAGAFTMDATQSIQTAGRNLTIAGASLSLGNLITSAIASPNNVGGTVNLTARNGAASAGNVTTTAAATLGPGATAIGGNVTINASTGITTGSINTSATATTVATGGNVSLTASNGDISFSNISTIGANATTSTGGNVSLIANGVIRGTAPGDTINTASPTQSGSVAIQHNGGVTNLPFVVGAPSGNGTTGAINAGGAAVITANTFPIPAPNGGSVVVGTAPNTITITGVNQAPSLTLNQTLTGGVQNQPLTFTYANLAPVIADADQDQTFLVVTGINTGTLTVNGVTATVGTVIPPGAILVYTPPTNTTGLITGAFTVAASDRLGLSSGASGQININVTNVTAPTIPIVPPPEDGSPLATILQGPPTQNANPSTTLALSSLPCSAVDIGVDTLDNQYSQEYEEYLGKQVGASKDRFLAACDALNQVEAATGVKPAIVYVSFVPTGLDNLPASQTKSLPSDPIAQLRLETPRSPNSSPNRSDPGDRDLGQLDQLEIVAVIPNGQPIYRRVSGATRGKVLDVVRQFTHAITDPITRQTTDYLQPAQQLYRWFVQPLEADLQQRKVDNLVFIMDVGLRSLPLAALHDGTGFLIERYSVGLMPSLSLTDTRQRDVKTAQVLGMGAAQFAEQRPLPAVPVELNTILQSNWMGKTFLNEQFTLNNLKAQRQQTPYGIVHLATHAEFKPGTPDQSYIQLWNSKLRLDQVRQLGWNNPPVELLVLSACRTALGDTEAELGFAGLAYQTGVRSALASLWAVDDEGTLAFMAEFYQRLRTSPIKAIALQQVQLAMIRKQVRIEDGKLITTAGAIALPPELATVTTKDLAYPFYWAAFTLVGNPW